MVYGNNTDRLGYWLHQCVLRNTLTESKTVVSTSRDATVMNLPLATPEYICLPHYSGGVSAWGFKSRVTMTEDLDYFDWKDPSECTIWCCDNTSWQGANEFFFTNIPFCGYSWRTKNSPKPRGNLSPALLREIRRIFKSLNSASRSPNQ